LGIALPRDYGKFRVDARVDVDRTPDNMNCECSGLTLFQACPFKNMLNDKNNELFSIVHISFQDIFEFLPMTSSANFIKLSHFKSMNIKKSFESRYSTTVYRIFPDLILIKT